MYNHNKVLISSHDMPLHVCPTFLLHTLVLTTERPKHPRPPQPPGIIRTSDSFASLTTFQLPFWRMRRSKTEAHTRRYPNNETTMARACRPVCHDFQQGLPGVLKDSQRFEPTKNYLYIISHVDFPENAGVPD